MREHRRAAARGDQLDGLLRPERAGVDVGRLTVGEQPVERVLRGRDVPGVDERRGDVRPADAALRAPRDVVPRDRVAELVEPRRRCARLRLPR